MYIFDIGGKKAVAGMKWRPVTALTAKGMREEAEKLSAEINGSHLGVTHAIGNSDGREGKQYGFLMPDYKGKKSIYSLALMARELYDNSFIVVKIPKEYYDSTANFVELNPSSKNDLFWLVGIHNGSIIPSTDVIDTRDSLRFVLNEAQASIRMYQSVSTQKETSQELKVVGDGAKYFIESSGDESTPHLDDIVAFNKSNLLRDLTVDTLLRNAMLSGGVLGGLALLGVGGYYALKAPTVQSGMDAINFEKQRRLAEAQAVKSYQKEVQSKLFSYGFNAPAKNLMSVLSNIRKYESNWDLQIVSCVDFVCKLQYKALTPNDGAALAEALGMPGKQVVTNNMGTEANVIKAFSGDKPSLSLSVLKGLDSYSDFKPRAVNLLTNLKRAFPDSQFILSEPRLVGLQVKSINKENPNSYQEVFVELSGAGFQFILAALEVAKELRLHNTASAVSFSDDGMLAYKGRFKYAVK